MYVAYSIHYSLHEAVLGYYSSLVPCVDLECQFTLFLKVLSGFEHLSTLPSPAVITLHTLQSQQQRGNAFIF